MNEKDDEKGKKHLPPALIPVYTLTEETSNL